MTLLPDYVNIEDHYNDRKKFMTYFLIILTLLSGVIVVILSVIKEERKKFVVALAGVLLVFVAVSQLIIETKKKPDLIRQYHEEIEDFRDWKSEEASYRILGNIIRLAKLGQTSFDLNRVNLSGIHLKGLKIKNSDLRNIDLSNSYISDCLFENVDFTGASFTRATVVRSSFINSKIDRINYFDAILLHVDFRGSDLSHFDVSNNLHKSRVIYGYKNIDKKLLQIIRTKQPKLLEKPSSIKMNRWFDQYKFEEK